PRVAWFEYLDWGRTAGRTYENGAVHLVHPENWKNGRKYNSERQWVHTVYHEMGHYVLWADAERKADNFAYRFVRGLSAHGQGRDRAGDVLRDGQAAARVPPERLLEHELRGRNLPGRRRIRHPGAHRVDRDAGPAELQGELAHVRLERRLGGGYRTVKRHHTTAAGARHGEDPAALAEQAAAEQVLHPVDEAVRHDVERHLELSLRRLLA